MRRAITAAALTLIGPAVSQAPPVVITIGVSYCPAYSSTIASLSSILTGYSSNSPNYGTMTVPGIGNTGQSSISTEPFATTSSAPSIPTQSTSVFADLYHGQLYTAESNTGISGVAIEPVGHPKSRKRQSTADSGYTLLKDCASSCSSVPNCQAVFLLGRTCILYSSVKGTMFLLGGEAAFNQARFVGFSNSTTSGDVTAVTQPTETGAEGLASASMSTGTKIPSMSVTAAINTYPSSLVDSSSSAESPEKLSGTTYTPASTSSGVFSLPAQTSVTNPSQSAAVQSQGTSDLQTTPASVMGSTLSSISMSPLTPATSPTMSQITTSSTATIPSAAPTYVCPTDSQKLITDINGIQYNLECRSDTYGMDSVAYVAATSFNDCFSFCDATPGCAGFTYSGAADGAGSGYCYLKKGPMHFQGGGVDVVGAIRVTPQPTVTSSSVTVVTSSSVGVPLIGSSTAQQVPSSSSAAVSLSTLMSVSSNADQLATSLSTSGLVVSPTSLIATSQSTSIPGSSSSTSANSAATSMTTTSVYSRNTGKRGLCYTNDSYTLPYSQSGQNSQVSWSYDYYYSPHTSNQNSTLNPAITFIPLLFNDDPTLAVAWPSAASAALDAGADALLSFNEPDLCYPGSACMSINASVTAYKHSMMPFANRTRLGAPAVTNGGYPSSLTYLSWFLGNCTSCQVDFICLHWYSNVYAFSYLQYYIQEAHAQFPNLPIWLTEFGIDSTGGSDAQVQAFLQQALPWLDAVPYVERYAWFYDGPGFLIDAGGDGLNAQGTIYNSYTAPCANYTNSDGHC